MNLEFEKEKVKTLGLDERIAYIGDLMIKMGDDLACEAGFSGAAWEVLKGYLVCKLFYIDELGGRIIRNSDLLNPKKIDEIKYYFCQLEKELAQEAEKLLIETKSPTDEQVELWMHYIEKARHN